MKKVFLALTLIVGAVFVTSCSSGSLDEPEFKSSSALYQATQPDAVLSSVEFTESGNYVVIRNVLSQNAPQSNTASNADETKELPTLLLASPWSQPVTRSTTYNNIITGKYTKTGDTTYVLEGFGTVTVNASGGNTYSLVITETGSSAPYTLAAARKEQYKGSASTDKLCRTWRIAEMRLEVKVSGQEDGVSFNISVDEKVDGGDLAELMMKCYESLIRKTAEEYGGDVPESEVERALADVREEVKRTYPYVENMIFTQAGTYMVIYRDNMLAVSTWAWTDNDFKSIRYSWDYNNMEGAPSGECSVEFDGKKCYLVENSNVFGRFADGGYGSGNGKMTYTLEAE